MKAKPTALSDAARLEIEQWMATASPDEQVRARCILMAATGAQNNEISLAAGLSRQAVGKWRTRYAELGLEGIKEPRRGRKPKFCADAVEAVVTLRLFHGGDAGTGGSWSIRKLARASGMSFRTVQKIVKAASLDHPARPAH